MTDAETIVSDTTEGKRHARGHRGGAAWKRDREDTDKLRRLFVDKFPKAFMPKGAEKTPLKIGIGADLFEIFPDISRKRIRSALADYTGGPTYLRNVVVGASRLNLEGAPVEVVDQDGEWHAKARMARFERYAIHAPMRAMAEALTRILGAESLSEVIEIAGKALDAHNRVGAQIASDIRLQPCSEGETDVVR